MEQNDITTLLKKLKPRERKFVKELRRCGRQGQAAILAGFPEKSADVLACRLMKKPEIQQALSALYEQDCKALCISKDSIILRAHEIYNRCMQIEPVIEYNKNAGEWNEVGKYTFDSKGAAKALDVIIKVAGLDKSEINIKNTVPFDVNIKVVE